MPKIETLNDALNFLEKNGQFDIEQNFPIDDEITLEIEKLGKKLK